MPCLDSLIVIVVLDVNSFIFICRLIFTLCAALRRSTFCYVYVKKYIFFVALLKVCLSGKFKEIAPLYNAF